MFVVARLFITKERRGSDQVVFRIVTSKDVPSNSGKRLAEIRRSLSVGVDCQSKEGSLVGMLSLECAILMYSGPAGSSLSWGAGRLCEGARSSILPLIVDVCSDTDYYCPCDGRGPN